MSEKTETKTDKDTQSSEVEDMFHKAYLFGLGLRKDIEEAVNKLIERGEEETEEKERAIDDVFKKAKEKTAPLEHKLEELVNKALDSMNLVTKERFEALEKRVMGLEQRLQQSMQEKGQ